MVKKFSIANSTDIQEFMDGNPPTKGIMNAFQFGFDFWMGVYKMSRSNVSFTLSEILTEEENTTIEAFHTFVAGISFNFRKCDRITLYYQFSAMPSYATRAVHVEISGYRKGQKDAVVNLDVLFEQETGEIVEFYGFKEGKIRKPEE